MSYFEMLSSQKNFSGDWFAGCVPLACLGKDEDLRMMLKMLFWLGMGRDLVGLEVARRNPFG